MTAAVAAAGDGRTTERGPGHDDPPTREDPAGDPPLALGRERVERLGEPARCRLQVGGAQRARAPGAGGGTGPARPGSAGPSR